MGIRYVALRNKSIGGFRDKTRVVGKVSDVARVYPYDEVPGVRGPHDKPYVNHRRSDTPVPRLTITFEGDNMLRTNLTPSGAQRLAGLLGHSSINAIVGRNVFVLRDKQGWAVALGARV